MKTNIKVFAALPTAVAVVFALLLIGLSSAPIWLVGLMVVSGVVASVLFFKQLDSLNKQCDELQRKLDEVAIQSQNCESIERQHREVWERVVPVWQRHIESCRSLSEDAITALTGRFSELVNLIIETRNASQSHSSFSSSSDLNTDKSNLHKLFEQLRKL